MDIEEAEEREKWTDVKGDRLSYGVLLQWKTSSLWLVSSGILWEERWQGGQVGCCEAHSQTVVG